MTPKITLIHWFRKGLRVHDNPMLHKVFELAQADPQKYVVRPVFMLDPTIISWQKVGANRWRFLQESLQDLHEQLLQLNSRLYVVRGKPADEFARVFKEWNVELLTFEEDIEPFALTRDKEVRELAKKINVKVETCCSHTIYNPELVIQKNLGKAPLTYQKFLSIVEKMKVAKSLAKPAALVGEKPLSDLREKENAECYDYPTMEQLVKNPQELGPRKFPGGKYVYC